MPAILTILAGFAGVVPVAGRVVQVRRDTTKQDGHERDHEYFSDLRHWNGPSISLAFYPARAARNIGDSGCPARWFAIPVLSRLTGHVKTLIDASGKGD
jgi:hypothetical protein